MKRPATTLFAVLMLIRSLSGLTRPGGEICMGWGRSGLHCSLRSVLICGHGHAFEIVTLRACTARALADTRPWPERFRVGREQEAT